MYTNLRFTKAPFTRYNRLSNPLSNRLSNRNDNRLYRVNGVLHDMTQSLCLLWIAVNMTASGCVSVCVVKSWERRSRCSTKTTTAASRPRSWWLWWMVCGYRSPSRRSSTSSTMSTLTVCSDCTFCTGLYAIAVALLATLVYLKPWFRVKIKLF